MKTLFLEHPFWVVLTMLSVFCSLRISLGLWMLPKHKKTGVSRRLFWSVVSFIPLAGPFFFGAFYRVPEAHRYGGIAPNPDAMSGGHGGF
jgi:ABC-type sugar transport system permease subunit